jgi:hypothetical protein
MTTYLMNALPNSLFPTEGCTMTVTGISEKEAVVLLTEPDWYIDFDDNITPRVFTGVSAVGHASTAKVLSRIFNIRVNAHHAFSLVESVVIPHSRVQVTPVAGDVVVAALFTSTVRLEEGVQYTEQELLALPIRWIVVDFDGDCNGNP